MTQPVIAILVGGSVVSLVVTLLLVRSWLKTVPAGQALVISGAQGERQVSFTRALVFPVLHRAETIDLSVHQVVIARRGKDGVICRDNIRADMEVRCFVRVGDTVEDVLAVARTIGCARASDARTLDELFTARFSEAIKIVGKQHDFEELFTHRAEVKDEIIAVIGADLNGFRLDDVVIDVLEQTPLEALDPRNILDAQGIEKILSRSRAADRDRVARRAEPLQDVLDRAGLKDVRVVTEVSCDVAAELVRVSLELQDEPPSPNLELPPGVPRHLLAAVGRGELSRDGGRATFRWTQLDVSAEQLVAGARLVRALREDPRAYR